MESNVKVPQNGVLNILRNSLVTPIFLFHSSVVLRHMLLQAKFFFQIIFGSFGYPHFHLTLKDLHHTIFNKKNF